jgi:hypothetical protein
VVTTQETADRIEADVERKKQSRQWRKDHGQYVPDALTYLRGKQWEGKDDGRAHRGRRISSEFDESMAEAAYGRGSGEAGGGTS